MVRHHVKARRHQNAYFISIEVPIIDIVSPEGWNAYGRSVGAAANLFSNLAIPQWREDCHQSSHTEGRIEID